MKIKNIYIDKNLEETGLNITEGNHFCYSEYIDQFDQFRDHYCLFKTSMNS